MSPGGWGWGGGSRILFKVCFLTPGSGECVILSTTLKAKRGRCAPVQGMQSFLLKFCKYEDSGPLHPKQPSNETSYWGISVSATWHLAVQSHVIDSLHDAPSSSSRFVIPHCGPSCTPLLMRQAERHAKFLFQFFHQVCVTEVLSR